MAANHCNRHYLFASLLSVALACALVGTAVAAPEAKADAAKTARKILQQSGVQGGMVVHVGCDDGRLTAALRANPGYTVHGLDPRAEDVAAAREYIASQDLYGPVSVEQCAGPELPYADNLIDLVVVSHAFVPRDEVLRVLAPEGVAMVDTADGWRKIVKPRPENIDDWTHYLHDASGNAVADDTMVGPPRSLQWVAPPLWLRSHETPSGIEALVSSDGRLFYFFDEGIIGITDQRLPERWALVCRDAFNGKLLWKHPVATWGWPAWAADKIADQDWTTIRGARTVVPEENQRRLVAQGDRLYATLSYEAPLSILDAATGKVLHTVADTAPVREIVASDGVVVVHSGQPVDDSDKRRGKSPKKGSAKLTAVDGANGRILWQKETEAIPALFLAIDDGRVVYRHADKIACRRLADGEQLWEVSAPKGNALNLLVQEGVVVLYAQKYLFAFDAANGKQLWKQQVPGSGGSEKPDLFVVGGVVWRGIVPVNEDLKPAGKSADAMALGFDLHTGQQKQQIVVRELRSPEHHHRCYRNKATTQYIISGMEGAEFFNLTGEDHNQNNWLRGACKHGIMPCNGLLYVPADQCFCQPGAKILGFTAVAGDRPARQQPLPDDQRLERGEAYGQVDDDTPAADGDWPTFRHDAARHGSTTAQVPTSLATAWRTPLGGRLTQPVAAGGRAYVAQRDAHTVCCIDLKDGKPLWKFIAGGRVDSPPTIYQGMVLFGSADGRVYCLRASDGALCWRFLAAPIDRRIGSFDQIESVWPVHGSVLLRDGVAYATAGRSTYLDGGIRVYALDPATGKLLRQTVLSGPFHQAGVDRDVAFYITGANSDVLVAEGDSIYMRQKKLTPELQEVDVPVFSSKGAQDVGLHVFSTASLIDDSWYNRTFWMYSKRWPGFQLANQASKAGQLLVVDDENTYALRVFYRRNVHSPMFFPAKEGYLLFADSNSNEPQLVGEPGWRKPLEWLPQSHIPREGNPGLDSEGRGFGADKGIGYTRAEPPLWTRWIPIRVRAMVKTSDALFGAGPPDELDPADPYAALEGRKGARLAVLSPADGSVLKQQPLGSVPVFDGMIAVDGHLLLSLEDGSLLCLGQGDARQVRAE